MCFAQKKPVQLQASGYGDDVRKVFKDDLSPHLLGLLTKHKLNKDGTNHSAELR